MTTSKVVVGVDGSEHSARAVKWCADHADALGAEVVAVHAIDLPIAGGMPPMPAPVLTAEQRDEVRDVVARDWCKPLADAGVVHRVVVVDGSPGLALMRVAREEEAELVVTGRLGRGGFAELLLGSTSHELSHALDRPLIIIP